MHGRWASLAIALALGTPPALAAPVTVFERLYPLETRTGVARIFTVETPLLELPTFDEQGLPEWSERRYARLYSIEYALEIRRADEAPLLEDRGNVVLALGLPPSNLKFFDERLRRHLASLAPDAFRQPHAGMWEGQTPLNSLGAEADPPSWSCKTGMEGGGSRVTEYLPKYREENGRRFPVGEQAIGHGNKELDERVCGALLRAAADASTGAHEIRTLSVPVRVREVAVELATADTLPEDILTKKLALLPQGAQWTRTYEESGKSGVSFRSSGGFRKGEDGTMVPVDLLDSATNGASWLLNHEQWEATTAPAAVSPRVLEAGSFVSRWILEEITRELGPEPKRQTHRLAELTLAMVPVAQPPLTRDGVTAEPDPGPVTPAFDSAAWVTDVARRLNEASSLDGKQLEAVLVDAELSPFPGFLLLACRDDGTAWYGLPPTRARSRILDPAPLCAAVRAQVSNP